MAFRSLMPFGLGSSGLPGRRAEEDVFFNLRRDIDRLFDDFFRGAGALPAQEGMMAMPSVDMSETEKDIQVVAELPGVDAKDLDVQLSGNTLTIKGEKKSDREEKDKNYHLVERSYGSFARTIRLPYEVDADKVEASFDKGVLKITMPKPAEMQQAARRITVKKGAG